MLLGLFSQLAASRLGKRAPKWRLERDLEEPAPTQAPFMGRPVKPSLRPSPAAKKQIHSLDQLALLAFFVRLGCAAGSKKTASSICDFEYFHEIKKSSWIIKMFVGL